MIELICSVALTLLGYYVTLGLMAIGAGVMLAGARGASAAARFWFQQPLLSAASGVAWLIGQMVSALGVALLGLGNAMITYVVDPLLRLIGRGLSALLFPRRR